MYEVWFTEAVNGPQYCVYSDAYADILYARRESWTEDVDLTAVPVTARWYIDGSGNYVYGGANYKSKLIPIPDTTKTATIVPKSGSYTYYALLTSDDTVAGPAPFATGETGRVRADASTTVNVPSDARYLWVYTYSTRDISPSAVSFSGEREGLPESKPGLLSPKLKLSAGGAGSLEFSIPPGGAGYDTIQRLTSTMYVKRDEEIYWIGRPISEHADIWGNRQVYCEGALAFLNDTVPMVANPTVASVLQAHNGKTASNRWIDGGRIEVVYTDTSEADGSTSLDIINSKLVGNGGGVLRMRYPNGVPTLDWLNNYPSYTGNEQKLTFGENLLDFTRNWDMSEYCTYCFVRGAEIQTQEGESTGTYYNSGWITIGTVAAQYGRIEKYLDYSDLQSDQECIAAAQTYLATQQFAEMTIDVTALDLHILDPSIKPFDLLERVNVVSPIHGMDAYFAVTDMDIPLDAPENTSYTLGYVNVAYVRRVNTLTKQNVQQTQELQDEISSGVSDAKDYAEEKADDAYDRASQEASQSLATARASIEATMNSISQGYIFIDYDSSGNQGIYICDTQVHSVEEMRGHRVWKWDGSGFGYTRSFNPGGTTAWETAITMNGEISAKFILTDEMWADRIKLFGDMDVHNGKTDQIGGCLGYGVGNNGISIVPGIHLLDSSGQVEIMASTDGARMSYGGYHIYVGSGGVVVTGSAGTCDLVVNGDIYYSGSLYNYLK